MKIVKKKECNKCSRIISLSNYNTHYSVCNGPKNTIQIQEKWKMSTGKYKCPECNLEYGKSGIATHIWRSHGAGINHIPPGPPKGHIPWNKGLTKETSDKILQQANNLKRRYAEGELIPIWLGKKLSEKTRRKISKKLSINNKGGRCKWYEHTKPNGNKIKVQGTYELRFAKVLDIIDGNWIKPTTSNHSFTWCKDGIEHTYSPDFYVPKLNKYFEIKGYWWGDDKEKMRLVIEQNSNANIEIVFKKDLEYYEKLII